jgi:hypothetical protein
MPTQSLPMWFNLSLDQILQRATQLLRHERLRGLYLTLPTHRHGYFPCGIVASERCDSEFHQGTTILTMLDFGLTVATIEELSDGLGQSIRGHHVEPPASRTTV